MITKRQLLKTFLATLIAPFSPAKSSRIFNQSLLVRDEYKIKVITKENYHEGPHWVKI